jgi:hypothetical protein
MVATSALLAPSDSNGHAPKGVGRRSRRRPWVATAGALVVACVLGGLSLVGALGHRTTVLQAARDIEVGQVIAAGDLVAVDVAVDSPAQLIAAADRDQLVGLTASGRLPAGSLVSPADFGAGTGLPAGHVVISIAVAAGELPRPDLRIGDRVRLIQTTGPAASASSSGETAGAAALGEATVFALPGSTSTSGSGGFGGSAPVVESSAAQSVSLVVAENLAGKVAQASAGRALRLVYVPGGAR